MKLDFFTRSHLCLSKDSFEEYKSKGFYELDGNPCSLTIDEAPPSFELFQMFLDRVGGPWHWPARRTYHAEQDYWEKAIRHPESDVFVLRKDSKPIGFCHVGLMRFGLVQTLGRHGHVLPAAIEIKHFGLFLEETGKGYGRYFLPQIFEKLFASYEAVYLNTRSTNHAKVVPFYQSLGMKVFHMEELPSDLMDIEKVPSSHAL